MAKEEDKDPVLSVIKWEDFLQDFSKDEDYIHGYVTDETTVGTVLELYRRVTKTTFFTRRSISPRITNDGVPFMYGGMKTLECQYGPKRDHGKKSDVKTVMSTVSSETMDSTHEYITCSEKSKHRLSTGETRKKGCRAKISVWHICRLPEYVVTAKKCVTIWQTKAKEKLLQDLKAGKEVTIENRFYISLPLQKTHTNHSPCGQYDEVHSVHPQVIRQIDQLVAEGVTTIRNVRAALKQYVQTTMSDIVAPDEQDRAYYPTLKDIANHIYKSKVKQQILKLDIEPLGIEEEVHSVDGETETAGNGQDDTSPSPPSCLQLKKRHSHSDIIIPLKRVVPPGVARVKDIANHIYKSKVKQRILKLDIEPLGIEEEVHSVDGETETAGNGQDDTSPSPPSCLQLKKRHSHSDIIIPLKRVVPPGVARVKDIANHIYKSKVKQRILKLDIEPLGIEEEVHSVDGETETAGNGQDDTSPSPLPCLQLNEPDSHFEITIPIEEITSSPEEAAHRERKELHRELTSIRRLSSKCTDAATLAEVKAGIAALRDKFKNSLKEQSASPSATQTPKRQKQANNSPGQPPTKTARSDNGDHVY
ncbi:uncharacterized protein carf isoform X2 [Anabas testudineus]|uniref:Uncharacterized protein n=1 Tax=Anabas testudineus TaxID=64144 RepID=A0A3Q1HGU4_ANATE|nr:uncharacterized protein carf isoform X2 [Anabas testudineus]